MSVLFSFNQAYPLDEMHIYNGAGTFPQYQNYGINEAEILVSTVNSNDRNDWHHLMWNFNDGVVNATPRDIEGVTNDPYSVDEIVELDGYDGQYVLLSVKSNHGATWETGAGEFRFFAVPEPSTTLLMALGGGLLFLRRRA